MTNPYADMSYDELSAHVESADASPTSIAEATEEMQRKSAIMTAICKLAAELDEEGWVLVPRKVTAAMHDAVWWTVDDEPELDQAWAALLDAAPPLNHGETA